MLRGISGVAVARLRDLGSRVPQRRADLIDLHLKARALLAVVLVAADGQPSGHEHPHALAERFGDVLAVLAPHGAANEHRLPVLPLLGLAIERARCRGDGERRDGRAGGDVVDFWVACQVADDGDDRFVCHGLVSFPEAGFQVEEFLGWRTC